MFYEPLNPLPPACEKCGFPDLDHVPQPYYLVRSRTQTPNEMALAENGNLLVRERVQRVLETCAPNTCDFYPTHYQGGHEETPWRLLVPRCQVATAEVQETIPRCKACGRPRSAHPGTQYTTWLWDYQSEWDVLKASTWGSSERGWKYWVFRDCFMSIRLFRLLKKIRARGLDEVYHPETPRTSRAETAWIDGQLERLKECGVSLHPTGSLSDEDTKWFRAFIRNHAAGAGLAFDRKQVEKQLGVSLPNSYAEFIAAAGPAVFEDVDEEEGFQAQILAPHELDATTFRLGALAVDNPESRAVDGVMFARTGHGDCFCFDVRKDRKEFEVFLFNHELGCFEPYAENFAACIKRFAGG